jgi:hypothetical protein
MNNRRAREQTTPRGRGMPVGYLVARFIRFYGRDMFWSREWPTADGAIPFRLFYPMLAAIAHVAAAEQADAYFAALLAGAMIHGGDEGKATRGRHVEQLLATAYPEAAP